MTNAPRLGDLLTYAASAGADVGGRIGKSLATGYVSKVGPLEHMPLTSALASEVSGHLYDEAYRLARTGRGSYFKAAGDEAMTREGLIQTAKDLPVAAAGGGLGYLAGRMLAEKYDIKGTVPPVVGAGLTALASMKLQSHLRQRRQEASEA